NMAVVPTYISSATWWKGVCGSEALFPVASIILQIPPTSAASELNWSLFGNTHTKARNRLTN
ncbi:hAT transposon family protein, partial [Escherichia coli]|uniref:hAT transposon family protein n=1 Tax=Escherichia coli TaxID=562 RepID=UPI001F192D69